MSSETEEERIGYQLKVLDRMFRKRMEADMRQNGYDHVTMTNGWIIDYLIRHDGEVIFQKDLEQRLKVGKSSLSCTLKIMEEKGFVERRSVQSNARVKQVVLTDKARDYHCKMERDRLRTEQQVTKGLSEQELLTFRRIVKKMQNNLQG